jgi:hypothetical protein
LVFFLFFFVGDGEILLRKPVNPNVGLTDLPVDLILEIRNLLLEREINKNDLLILKFDLYVSYKIILFNAIKLIVF